MSQPRASHTATVLPDGRVLVSGGSDGTAHHQSAEIYDPSANTWSSASSMSQPRSSHTATLLPDGRVLVAGGINGASALKTAEIFDSSVNTWTPVADMGQPRSSHTATLLPDGRVLVAGGYDGASALKTAELFDAGSGLWTPGPSMSDQRASHKATLLPDGRVLVSGGFDNTSSIESCEHYDTGLGFTWQPEVTSIPATSGLDTMLSLTGSGFRGRGFAEASGGGTGSSATNYPLVQLMGIEGGQIAWLSPDPLSGFSDTAYASSPVSGILPGHALARVYVNGVPGIAKIVLFDKSTASMALGSLLQVYDGTAKSVTVETVPPGLKVVVTYDGSLLPPTAAGSYNISAYIDDLLYSGDTAGILTVSKNSSATAVSSDNNPSFYGQQVTFTADVSSSSGPPPGAVQFRLNGTEFGPAVALVAGRASVSTSSLTPDNYTITAEYTGDANYISSSGAIAGGQTVARAPVSVNIAALPNPSVYGQTALFTAHVTSAAGVPTGTLRFRLDGVDSGPALLLSGGMASINIPDLTAGDHQIEAEYSGDSNYAPATGTLTGGQTVNKAASMIIMATSPNPSLYGQQVTLTAAVSSDAGVPAGTVQFRADGADIGTPVPLAAGAASFSTSSLTGGIHAITAAYSGDANHSSADDLLGGGQTVNRASTSVIITALPATAVYGQQVTFTATVTSGAGTPGGSVLFRLDAADIAPPVVLASGVASLVKSGLPMGSHAVTFEYSGDTNFSPLGGALAGGLTIAYLPSVITGAADNVTPDSAVLNGTVMANYAETTAAFHYGTDIYYSGGPAATDQGPLAGDTITNVTGTLTGLVPGTLYHFRIFGTNLAGTAYGGDLTFTTGCYGPVRIGLTDYADPATAYQAAVSDDVIRIRAAEFTGDILANTVGVVLNGGYDCGFASNNGHSAILGTLTIGDSGVLTLDRIILR